MSDEGLKHLLAAAARKGEVACVTPQQASRAREHLRDMGAACELHVLGPEKDARRPAVPAPRQPAFK